MRAIYVAIPAGLALATAGAALMVAAHRTRDFPVIGLAYGSEPDLIPGAVRHLVTPTMSEETAKRARAVVPTFDTTDSEGKSIRLGAHDAVRPQFVYFVLDGCPCSYDAEPLFHKLFQRYRDKIDFAAVTDGDRAKAHDWNVRLLVNYPVVPDPAKKIIHAYGARASVYSMLIGPDGRVVKMWPGYSADLLRDINSTMAKSAGVTEEPFDPEYAPKTKATGCAF